ncbi:MAG: M24 family metallopeptidase [Hyphococcus sp.]
MTIGVGVSTIEAELEDIQSTRARIAPIPATEIRHRIQSAQRRMADHDVAAMFVSAGSNLKYFTGIDWHPSERLFGALIPQDGAPIYIVPAFEKEKTLQLMTITGEVRVWEEDECPYQRVLDAAADSGAHNGRIGLNEDAPFFLYDGLRAASERLTVVNAAPVTTACRMQKTKAELAIMQHAKTVTMDIHRRTGRILREGMTTGDVVRFIDKAHRKAGADGGSTFCIVAFGEATAFPHGAEGEQTLRQGDIVLIDTGCQFHGYHSDITRTYVFGEPTARHREIWNIEKEAQAAAFDAARPGATCHDVDRAARTVIERHGLGPGYKTPGLPHRTGHGIGLDIHEHPYLVKGSNQVLAEGMCCSNEPMICSYGEFGVRLEDHFYITDSGAAWFTEPSESIDNPFNL